jgi:hypothetical protein
MEHLFPEPPRLVKRAVPATVNAAAPAVQPAAPSPPAPGPVAFELAQKMPEAPVAGPTFERDWYYAHNMQEMGPVTQAQLAALISDGQLPADGLVWTDGMADWSPAGQVVELAAHFGQPPLPCGPATFEFGEQQVISTGGSPTSLAAVSLILSILGLNVLYLAPFAVARWSLLAGVLSGLFYLLGVAAIVSGHVALGQIRRSFGQFSGRRAAMAGLVVGYLGVGAVTVAAVGYLAAVSWRARPVDSTTVVQPK